MMVRVINPAGQMSLVMVGADAPVPVGQPVVAVINTQGVSINAADICATAKGLCIVAVNVKKPVYVPHKITSNCASFTLYCGPSLLTIVCLLITVTVCLLFFLLCTMLVRN